ncbi:Glutathione S-transferase P [Holothuria leucospilota]|uniref:Glutathione S-transferase P n=1 Tax=Holothuria leucospilota TaxID=206669 RepID=A0A9Q1C9K8_HOLLE|nr:Glutathione S-transferase P [Holothuria leucospilota]
MSGAFLQLCAVVVAAIATIYVTGQGTFLARKTLELFHGKAGCVPVPAIANVTVHYFDIRGRAEAIRLILEDTGISYNQELFTGETWPGAKKKGIESGIYTFGQVPAIVTDSGFSLVQSQAIVHYIGRATGLDCDCQDVHLCEILAAGAEDFRSKLSRIIYDPNLSVDMRDDYLQNVAPVWLNHFEKLAPQIRDEETSFFVGGRITWVDYIIFDLLDGQVEFGRVDVGRPLVDVLDPYPKLNSFYNRFRTREKIAAYLKSDRRHSYNAPKIAPSKSGAKE